MLSPIIYTKNKLTQIVSGVQLFVAFFIFIFVSFVAVFSISIDVHAAANADIFEEYKKELMKNGGFPLNANNEVQKVIAGSPYQKIFMYFDQKDFEDLIDIDERNKVETVPVAGFIIREKKFHNKDTLAGRLKNTLLPSQVQFFTGDTSLRGGLSLHCGKASFKIDNDALDFTYKLKGSCGANYGVEERLFGGLIEHLSSPLLHPYHVFFKQQKYVTTYVNGKLYGLYLNVPAFDSEYLEENGVAYPKKKDNCLLKIGRFVIPRPETPVVPISSRLELNDPNATDDEIEFVVETKYGNDDTCLETKKELLQTINQKSPKREDLEKMIHPESILLWGLILWNTNNHISFTHNYLLVEHKDKFAAGFWDVEDFQGCKKQDINEYRSKDNRTTNALFTRVLRRYQQNDPERIKFFENMIDERICNFDPYHYFKNTDLQYVLADRYLRNAGNITPIDRLEDGEFVQDFLQAYEQKLDFTNFFKKHYNLFDSYFGVKGE